MANVLLSYLTDRDVLLVLDNCDHVVEQCAELAVALLTSCARVRILATSREPLSVLGETVWRLEPLGAEDARRLFVERARQRRPEFAPGVEADATIARLCTRLDRLPLAIELAAARVAVMSPVEILSSLDTQVGWLGGGTRISPAHHRTVRAAVAWSHRLLDAASRRLFVAWRSSVEGSMLRRERRWLDVARSAHAPCGQVADLDEPDGERQNEIPIAGDGS